MNDLHRQFGAAGLMVTMAPLEYNVPYSAALQDSLQKTGRRRLRLAALEVDHVMHLLKQAMTGFFCGIAGLPEKWRNHGLKNIERPRERIAKAVDVRMEMQRGLRSSGLAASRNAPPPQGQQQYHGRNAPHIHSVVWLSDWRAAGLDHVLRAHASSGDQALDALDGRVQGSHTDALPFREEPTCRRYSGSTLTDILWHYPWSAWSAGLRMFCPQFAVGAAQPHGRSDY